MLHTSELDMAYSVTSNDVDVILDNVAWAICSTYHTVLNSLTPKSVPAGTKLVLFGRYVLNIYVGIVRYFYAKRKLGAPKSTYRHNAQIGEYHTILTSTKKIQF